MKIWLFLFALVSLAPLYGQGIINITQDVAIEQALDKHKQINQNIGKIDGWTVQILSSNDRQKITTTKGEFLQTFPGIKVDWDYDRPFFKLRAGVFQTKLEATRLLSMVKGQYPSAYLSKFKFNPREFLY